MLGRREWIDVALREIGVAEIPGGEHNPRIIEYHAATTLKATSDEISWCSSFLNWVFLQVGIRGTGSAAAATWLFWGREILRPAFGAVVVLERVAARSAYEGLRAGQKEYPPAHVGLVIRDEGEWIAVLGGNQGNRVKVSRFLKSRVLAYRFPAEDGDAA